nr:hypothetical protein [uncultured Undibacterium sp.]
MRAQLSIPYSELALVPDSKRRLLPMLCVASLHAIVFLLVLAQKMTPPISIAATAPLIISAQLPSLMNAQATSESLPLQVSTEQSLPATTAMTQKVLSVSKMENLVTQDQVLSYTNPIVVPTSEVEVSISQEKVSADADATSLTANSSNSNNSGDASKPSSGKQLEAMAEAKVTDSLRIGELDNHVVAITKLGSSKAEYIAPNFLHPQFEKMQFQVDVGDFEDIETAVVNQIIAQIRTRYKKEIFWNSIVKARMVRLSMLPQDHAELEKFLKMEIFGKKKARDYSFWDKSKF